MPSFVAFGFIVFKNRTPASFWLFCRHYFYTSSYFLPPYLNTTITTGQREYL